MAFLLSNTFSLLTKYGIEETTNGGVLFDSNDFDDGDKMYFKVDLEKNDYIASIAPLKEDDSILVVGKPNSICTTVSELSEQSKNGSGTKIIERSTVQSVIVL